MNTLLLAIAVGFLFASGLYLMLRRSVGKFAIGLILLSHAANLLIFSMSHSDEREHPPILTGSREATLKTTADPLPQALILTAIVINFGILAFVATLLSQSARLTPNDDLKEIRAPER